MRKHHGSYAFTGIAKLSIVALLVSLSNAAIISIWAIYIDGFVHSTVLVGFISAFLTVVSFVSYFFFVPVIERFDKGKLFIYSLLGLLVLYPIFAFVKSLYLFLALALIATSVLTLRVTSFGILVKDASRKRDLSKNEGLKYTFTNIAFVLAPLIAAYALGRGNVSLVFYLASAFSFVGLLVFWQSKIKEAGVKKNVDKSVVKNFFSFFKSRDRLIAYVLGGGVNLWWVLIYLFMPLYIIRNGLSAVWVGYFLFAVAVPLILLEYGFSKMAGKKGFRKMFIIGFLTVAILAVSSFFVSNIFVIFGLLIGASFGMAMLEPTTEAYFFDILKGKEEYRYYGPYNTTATLNDFIGKILGALLLIFLPFKFVFLLFGGLMFLMFLVSFKTKGVVEGRRAVKDNEG